MSCRPRALASRGLALALLALPAAIPLPAQAPSAAASPVAHSATPVTLGERLRLHSASLGSEREIDVWVPPGAAADGRALPVLYVLDGESAFVHAVSAVGSLVAADLVPEMIVVGVRGGPRERDFTPKPVTGAPPGVAAFGGADAFVAFLADELVPFVDARHRTQPFRVVLGHSLGGLLAVHALTTRPSLFRGALTIEPSLWWDARRPAAALIDSLRGSPGRTGRLVTVEGGTADGWRQEWEALERAAPSTFDVELLSIEGEGHESIAFRGRYEGLRALFADWVPAMRRDAGRATLPALEVQYAALSRSLGYDVPIPRRALREVADRESSQRRWANAARALERLIAEGDTAASNRTRLEQLRRLAGEAPPEPSRPVVRARDAARFLGTWEGTERVEPGRPVEIALVFESSGDTLAGEGVARGLAIGGGDFRFPLRNLRVAGDTIVWERENSGGGSFVHTAVLRPDGELAGAVELVGAPPPPAGFVPPTVTFRLRRSNGGR